MNIVITGGNRGLGAAVAQNFLLLGHNVCVSVRSASAFDQTMEWFNHWKKMHGATFPDAQLNCVEWNAQEPYHIGLEFRHALAHCDVLVNNAGWEADLDPERRPEKEVSVWNVDAKVWEKAFRINVDAPRFLMAQVLPHMIKRGQGRIANVASALGMIIEPVGESRSPAYRLSKHALIALTVETAREIDHPDIHINAVCPGWCNTRMGGPQAPLSVDEGAQRIVDAALAPSHGVFYVNGQPSSL